MLPAPTDSRPTRDLAQPGDGVRLAFWSQKCCLSPTPATEALSTHCALLFTQGTSGHSQSLLLTSGYPLPAGADLCISPPLLEMGKHILRRERRGVTGAGFVGEAVVSGVFAKTQQCSEIHLTG